MEPKAGTPVSIRSSHGAQRSDEPCGRITMDSVDRESEITIPLSSRYVLVQAVASARLAQRMFNAFLDGWHAGVP